MERQEAVNLLRAHENELRQLGVEHLFLFGSTVRDEANPGSDIDLFIDYVRGRFGLFQLMEVEEAASRIPGHKADVMTRDSIHKTLRKRIEDAAQQICPKH